ncbi:zinc finger CCCH-type with G patch domain-containing protein-like [Oscarella lobularis]|uniref:zinc finger CCCH-type with G patch domain-containing protein-like n=1 Tax=Oscarella lobularis TaxID=121494 RepID=UPI0033131B9B
MADEESLEIALEQYRQQLSQIDALIQSDSDAVDSDLASLKANLEELVTLTEESLLSLKKGKLLKMLDSGQDLTEQEETAEKEEEKEEEEDAPKIPPGSQCRAPYQESYGGLSYHNAIVVCEETSNDKAKQVRVLFTHPTSKSMIPCPYYLDNKCKFSDEKCRGSHGHIVNVEDLDPYVEPDFTQLVLASRCLVKQDDNLWHAGTISAVVDGHYQIKLDALNKEVAAGPQDLFPLEEEEEEEDNDDIEEGEGEQGREEEDLRVLAPAALPNEFGEWEKYTTGIGSKLLQKMGFSLGKGLGKKGEGIQEPIDIVILPPGKSLDVCVELKKKKQLKNPFKTRRKHKGTAKGKQKNQNNPNVFDFINQKLGKGVSQRREAPKKEEVKGPEGAEYFHFDNSALPIRKRAQKERSKSDENLNVKLVKIQEEIKRVQRKLVPLEQALSRNEGRDRKMEAHVKEKMAAYRNQHDQLKATEKQIQEKLCRQTSDKKLRLF